MSVAIVLSGGGSRGDFEVGALRYLYDKGLRPNILCTTSVGSINGVKLAQGEREPSACYVYATQMPGTVPLYRFWNDVEHFYTRSLEEGNGAAGYRPEGIACYVFIPPAVAIGELAGYVTDFPGAGGARVVYRGQDGHIWELYCPADTGNWSVADLTGNFGGGPAVGEPAAYVTDFPGAGGARVVYRAEDGHIWELYCPAVTGIWSVADLTESGSGVLATKDLIGYVSDFPSRGGARVVYRAEDGEIWELYLWRAMP